MSWMSIHYECCADTGGGGDATMAKQDQILAAIAALQTDVDGLEVGIDNIEDCVCQPEIC